jgi:uncharacterized protein YndB with AHSA1/START domain
MGDSTEVCPAKGVNWKISLAGKPEVVFDLISTDAGREAFWAEESRSHGEGFRLTFANGAEVECRILASEPPRRFVFEYFGGTRVEFRLGAEPEGGTDFEVDDPAGDMKNHYPGWVAWLYCLKGATDHGITLKSGSLNKTWQKGYVDG